MVMGQGSVVSVFSFYIKINTPLFFIKMIQVYTLDILVNHGLNCVEPIYIYIVTREAHGCLLSPRSLTRGLTYCTHEVPK